MAERLTRVLDSRKEYEWMVNKIAELEAIAEKITTAFSKTPKGSSSSLKDDSWAKLIDYKNKLEFQIAICELEEAELSEELEVIRNENIRTAMKYRYIDGLKVQTIADKMNFDSRTIDRYLKKGRSIYYKYYSDENIY